jgi:hypothetical protein
MGDTALILGFGGPPAIVHHCSVLAGLGHGGVRELVAGRRPMANPTHMRWSILCGARGQALGTARR